MRTYLSRRLGGLTVATFVLAALVGGLGPAAWGAEPVPAPIVEPADPPEVVLTAALTDDGSDVKFTVTNNGTVPLLGCSLRVGPDELNDWWRGPSNGRERSEILAGESVSWNGDSAAPDQLTTRLLCYYKALPTDGYDTTVYSNFVTTANPKGYARSSMTQQLYRFYKTDGTHFYTASDYEASLVRGYPQYREENPLGLIAPADATNTAGLVPIHRFYKHAVGTHFYTTSDYEAELVKGYDEYRYEGIAGYAADWYRTYPPSNLGTETLEMPKLTSPVERYYKLTSGTHFYTDSWYEKSIIDSTAPEYRSEGVAFFIAHPLDPTWGTQG